MVAEQQSHEERIADLARQAVLALPDGSTVALQDGYIPLLIDYTHEDKAAKGLRKGKTSDQKNTEPSAVYYTSFEAVRDNEVLLLTGPPGSGKTTFAKYLCSRLTQVNDDRLETETSIFRNEEGYIEGDEWNIDQGSPIEPFYFDLSTGDPQLSALDLLINNILPHRIHPNPDKVVLLVFDAVENLGDRYTELIQNLVALVQRYQHYPGQARLLLLGDAVSCESWSLPTAVVKNSLLPLLQVQRRETIKHLRHQKQNAHDPDTGVGQAASNPALFTLAVQAGHRGDVAEDLIDAWLAHVQNTDGSENLLEQAYKDLLPGHGGRNSNTVKSNLGALNPAFTSDIVQNLLAARYLKDLPKEAAVKVFQQSPQKLTPVVLSLLYRLGPTEARFALVEALLRIPGLPGQLAALLVAEYIGDSNELRSAVLGAVQKVIVEEQLPVSQRVKAGSILSTLDDPRDLSALATIPDGAFTFGSETHPNSTPVGQLRLAKFRIGLYPVVNKDYEAFIEESGRQWLSPDQHKPERRNAPATDLTWHDARAYCSWLTAKWRQEGKISKSEVVRLPTEPEWERAARGDQEDSKGSAEVYPWGTSWQPSSSNNDTLGLNDKCCVGLFPSGRSPYGCYDMTGQVWEWCTTLWGRDMATPEYKYPWTSEDGREKLEDVDGSVRRVLRGGCFSSGVNKATCTYRGSLEPDGYWRGNGFRIVVSQSQ